MAILVNAISRLKPHVFRMTRLAGAAIAMSGCVAPSGLKPSTQPGMPLAVSSATLLTDNDDAFHVRLDMVRGASTSIDATYFIYSNDESSSVFSTELISAARRGVKVRLLVDLSTNYRLLDLFTLMEREGSRGKGSLEVRFFNRPTRNMIMDAAYATLPCPDGRREGCAAWKTKEIERRFAAGAQGSAPEDGTADGTGLFFSGLYAQNVEVLAFSILRGEQPSEANARESASRLTPKNLARLRELGLTFWQARAGTGFQRIVAGIKLSLARAFYGDVLDPLHTAITAYLPIDRRDLGPAARDWSHFTDYTHAKLLLVDDSRMVIGGRNIENSYHMRPNRLTGDRPVFRDTDLVVDFAAGGTDVRRSFGDLWSFSAMVASVEEIRAIAPNEFVANIEVFRASVSACAGHEAAAAEACVAREIDRRGLPLDGRVEAQRASMAAAAHRYRSAYPARRGEPDSRLPVDASAQFFYLENLPFVRDAQGRVSGRIYGAKAGSEPVDGKAIHATLAERFERVCRIATAAAPRRLILLNGYFLPPSDLLLPLGRMLTGETDCRHVTVTVVTNSRGTIDVNSVNTFGRYVMLALTEHVTRHRDPARAARFEYFETIRPAGTPLQTLHSKVWVLGDEILIGSANADLRSFMMDTNNGILIRNAPELVARYEALIDRLVSDPVHVRNATGSFVPAARASFAAEDAETLRKGAAHFGVGGTISPAQWSTLEKQFSEAVGLAYSLTLKALSGGVEGRTAGDRYDQYFKLF